MRKQDLIDAVADKTEMSKKSVGAVLEAMIDTIRDTLAAGDRVTLTGFGSFEVVQRNEREGRNPRTGKMIKIAARKAPQFRAGSELKRAVSPEPPPAPAAPAKGKKK